MVTLGVVADSHIPHRLAALPPAIFEAFEGVDAILHAGDVSVRRVLDELAQLAPVHAVAGNADLFLRSLPSDRVLVFEGVRIALAHGHGGWRRYLQQKVQPGRPDYYGMRIRRRLLSQFSGVHAIVFGHSHWPVNQVHAGVLLFNPGALGPNYKSPHGPTVGRLTISGEAIRGEIVRLGGRLDDWHAEWEAPRYHGKASK